MSNADSIIFEQHAARSLCDTTREIAMENATPQVVETDCDELHLKELITLSTEELERVSGGIGDPGIIEVEK